MRQARSTGGLVLGADVIPDLNIYYRRIAIFYQESAHAVRQLNFMDFNPRKVSRLSKAGDEKNNDDKPDCVAEDFRLLVNAQAGSPL